MLASDCFQCPGSQTLSLRNVDPGIGGTEDINGRKTFKHE